MANRDDYLAKLEAIQSIKDEDLLSPTMPVETFIQEAENLYHWCQDDQAQLTGAGLDWNWIEDLPIRAGACREAQSLWFKARFTRQEAQKEWKEKSPKAYDLRDELLHAMRYAYRKHPDILGRVQAIADGYGHADMIQDLNDIAVLGKEHIEPLQQIKLDISLLDQASNLADEMGNLLGRATVDKASDDKAKVIRDQAYTYLKQAVDEVRDCGQYVFWRDEERLKGYVSAYFRQKKKQRRSTESTADAQNQS